MIRYALACEQAHEFESWFPSAEGYDAQVLRGLVACPLCGSAKVEKQIMAPSIGRKDKAPAAAQAPQLPVAAPAPGAGRRRPLAHRTALGGRPTPASAGGAPPPPAPPAAEGKAARPPPPPPPPPAEPPPLPPPAGGGGGPGGGGGGGRPRAPCRG